MEEQEPKEEMGDNYLRVNSFDESGEPLTIRTQRRNSNTFADATAITEGGEFTEADVSVKVICLGDSAVGKSKLLERFLSSEYKPIQVSTFALTLYQFQTTVDEERVSVDFWDTAGQERFQSLHPSYYHEADACVMVFDATRKITYKNLTQWYEELRQYRPEIPVLVAANKIDTNMDITKRTFAFPEKHEIPLYYVSAATGTNVVKLFRDAVSSAVKYRKNPTHWTDQILQELVKTVPDDDQGQKGGDDEENSVKENENGKDGK